MNLLFIGNSITKHGKCSYWPGVWSMAASSPENDYVNLLVNKLRKSGQYVEYADINFFEWEIMAHDRDEVLPLIDDLLDKSYDYIMAVNCKCNLNTFRDFEKKSVYRILLW